VAKKGRGTVGAGIVGASGSVERKVSGTTIGGGTVL
jgi:hypothetical protein